MELRYRRWELEPGQTVASLLGSRRRGIYVLEFSDGSKYVGRSVNFVNRFTTHVHGSKHHSPWNDITAVSFAEAAEEDLAVLESSEIQRMRAAGFKLRNKVGNLGHQEPSPLDIHVSVAEQEHWATGAPTYDQARFQQRVSNGRLLASAPSPKSKAGSKRGPTNREESRFSAFCSSDKLPREEAEELLDCILDDLFFVLFSVIPNAVDTERDFWVLTDMPSTAGGRFACLSAGVLELAIFPRCLIEGVHTVRLNFPPGSLGEWEPLQHFDWEHLGANQSIVWEDSFPEGQRLLASKLHYRLSSVDFLEMPVGYLTAIVGDDPYLLSAARSFAITLMRQRSSSLFRRWHSEALVTEALEYGLSDAP